MGEKKQKPNRTRKLNIRYRASFKLTLCFIVDFLYRVVSHNGNCTGVISAYIVPGMTTVRTLFLFSFPSFFRFLFLAGEHQYCRQVDADNPSESVDILDISGKLMYAYEQV